MSVTLSLTVNGKAVSADVEPRTLLVEFLRDELALTGTHVGCDTGQCGACTVHVDGRAVKAAHPRRAGRRRRGHDHRRPRAPPTARCTRCRRRSGVPRPAVRLLHAGHGDERDRPRRSAIRNADEKTIREELEGNLCRCTGYHNIVKAVQQGAAAMRKGG